MPKLPEMKRALAELDKKVKALEEKLKAESG
jgi:hypothetical protein